MKPIDESDFICPFCSCHDYRQMETQTIAAESSEKFVFKFLCKRCKSFFDMSIRKKLLFILMDRENHGRI